MTVLVLAPHPDDESIGPGGTIRLHAERGDHVVVVFLTSGELGLKHLPIHQAWATREPEAAAACAVLGVAAHHFFRLPDWYLGDHIAAAAATLTGVVRDELPACIYLPHPREWHPDHKACLPIVSETLRGMSLAPRLLGYEVWTPLEAHDHVEDVTATMATKLRAIRCHQSQLDGFRYDQAIRGLSRYRGALTARCRYAEVFADLVAPSD